MKIKSVSREEQLERRRQRYRERGPEGKGRLLPSQRRLPAQSSPATLDRLLAASKARRVRRQSGPRPKVDRKSVV